MKSLYRLYPLYCLSGSSYYYRNLFHFVKWNQITLYFLVFSPFRNLLTLGRK